MEKIRKISRLCKFFLSVAALWYLILPIGAFILPFLLGNNINIENQIIGSLMDFSYKVDIENEPSFLTSFLIFLITMVPTTVFLFSLLYLIKLFKLYEDGIIFTKKNVYYTKCIAYCILVWQILGPIREILVSLVSSWNNPPGERFITFGFSDFNVGIIFIAFVILLISKIMSEACKIQEEQTYTV